MINENILAECLRCRLSSNGLSISPLTSEYIPPRWLPLIPIGNKVQLREDSSVELTKNLNEAQALHCPTGSCKTNKKADSSGRCLVIPCKIIQPDMWLLWTRCFVHSNLHGQGHMHVLNAEALLPPIKEVSTAPMVPRVKSEGRTQWVCSAMRLDRHTRGRNSSSRRGPHCNLHL